MEGSPAGCSLLPILYKVGFKGLHSSKYQHYHHIRYPESAKRLIKKGMFKEVSSVMSEKEFEKHFTPPYNPWEQRFCLAPGGDFFAPIRCAHSNSS